jgi:uncharacterized membrane protein required for colicin V production
MANWVDFTIIVLFAGTVLLEVKRGFGRAVFDLAALLVAVRAAPMLADPLSHSLSLSHSAATNSAIIYAACFALLGGLLIFLGKLVYDTTLISAETFDALLGGILGIGIAVILCHAFVRTIALTSGPSLASALVAQSAMGAEFLTFDSYHRLLEALYTFDRTEE